MRNQRKYVFCSTLRSTNRNMESMIDTILLRSYNDKHDDNVRGDQGDEAGNFVIIFHFFSHWRTLAQLSFSIILNLRDFQEKYFMQIKKTKRSQFLTFCNKAQYNARQMASLHSPFGTIPFSGIYCENLLHDG